MKMFEFGMKKSPAPSVSDNPYLNASRAWNSHVGSVLSSRQSWQIIGILALLIALAAVGGVVYIGSQSKFIPYVVEVDKLGQARAVVAADAARPVDNRVIGSIVRAFISDARMVTPDVALQRAAVYRVYAALSGSDAATVKMNEWLNSDNNPFQRAAKEMVSVQISSAIPQSAESWQVDWVETVRDRQGAAKGSVRFRALLSVYVSPPDKNTSEDQVQKNPFGIFVRDFSWAQQN